MFRKEKAARFTVLKPICGKQLKSILGKNGKAVRTIFSMRDVNASLLTVNILVTQRTDFADAETRRIDESEHGLLFEIRDRRNEEPDFLFGRDIGKIRIEFTQRELSWIPGFMKDIDREEAKLRNGMVDSTIRKISGRLKPSDKVAHVSP